MNFSLLLKGAVLFCVLVTSGCSQEFASLHFERDVSRSISLSEGDVSLSYSETLRNELVSQGIDLDQVAITPDVSDPRILHIRLLTRSFDPQRKGELRRFLEARLADRAIASFGATLQAHTEHASTAAGFKRPQRSPIPSRLELAPVGQHRIEIVRFGDLISTVLEKESDMYCDFIYTLKDRFPYRSVRLLSEGERKADGEINAEVVYLVFSRDAADGFEIIPASLKFHDENLMRLVNSGKVEIRAIKPPFNRGPSEFSFITGGLGRNVHDRGSVSSGALNFYRSECEKLGAHLGRPFSFFMGDSLDRLVSVTFHE